LSCKNEWGGSDFGGLKEAIACAPERLVFFAFDLMWLDDTDIRREPLGMRKQRLRELLGDPDPRSRLQYVSHVHQDGARFLELVCEMDLEGIVSKRLNSTYRSGRSKLWLKTKNVTETEFVVIGHDQPKGSPPCALLARERGELLEYVGSAFITLGGRERDAFWRRVEALAGPRPDVEGLTPRSASWLRPELRVRAKHLACAGKLRHATLVALADA
jgi:bifunctional non-homologous end joining protein LigD